MPAGSTIKLAGTQGSSPLEQEHIVLPLYYTKYVGCYTYQN